MNAIYDPHFSPGDKALVNYIDAEGRSVRGFCTVLGKHDVEGGPLYLINASVDVIENVGAICPHVTDLALVEPDELEVAQRILTLAVDNTKVFERNEHE
jgi:hypothetical protein